MTERRSIGVFIVALLLSAVAVAGFFFILNMHKKQQQLEEIIQKSQTGASLTKEEVKEVERVVETITDPWSMLQPKFKDTVVQIFSQVAEFDWLEPYKTPSQGQSAGTGFFINDKGDFITNAHVVDQAKALFIQIPSFGKERFSAEIICFSPDRDLALLRLKPQDVERIQEELSAIPYVKLGDSDKVKRGGEVMALGYPLGQQSLKSTSGVVSGRESISGRQFIQIDAPINPGNSGGPAINSKGEVIGINTAGIPGAQNVGYIIPINELKIICDDMYKASNKILRKPFLGVFLNRGATGALAKFLGNPTNGGVYVTDVFKGGLLDKAGVKAGDMLYEINGNRIDMYGEITASWSEDKISVVDYVSFLTPGQEISLVIYRKGKKIPLTFKFMQSELPAIRVMYPDYEKIDYEIVGGMVVMQLAINHLPLLITNARELIVYDEVKNQLEPALVITHIFPDSQAQHSRVVVPGTRIAEINGIEVKTLDEFRKAVKKSIDSGYLTIKTMNDVFAVYDFDKVMVDEPRLSSIYRFPMTPLMQDLMKAYIQKHEKKTGSTSAATTAASK